MHQSYEIQIPVQVKERFGAPSFWVYTRLVARRIRPIPIRLLVDTGSPWTALAPRDWKLLGLTPRILNKATKYPRIGYAGYNFERYITGRNVSPIGVSTRVQIAAQRFEQAMNLILDVASTEVLLRRIGNEIRKTTRRVNALEQILIPRLRAQMRYIRDTLEERAREDTFRLKRLKKAKLKKKS